MVLIAPNRAVPTWRFFSPSCLDRRLSAQAGLFLNRIAVLEGDNGFFRRHPQMTLDTFGAACKPLPPDPRHTGLIQRGFPFEDVHLFGYGLVPPCGFVQQFDDASLST